MKEREQAYAELKWWQREVIYQIAPMSFRDSNGDGKGDVRGIISRIPYLKWLGIDTIWLCPIYPSEMLDFGYDITNFCDIDPLFGTLADFDRLVDESHAREIKLLLDFVPNHTSTKHPWFTSDSTVGRSGNARGSAKCAAERPAAVRSEIACGNAVSSI